MIKKFTLEYWIEDGWYVGKLKEVPGVFSQGETLEELEENILDAYQLMIEDYEEYNPGLAVESVERHRQWQEGLERKHFFDQVFGEQTS